MKTENGQKIIFFTSSFQTPDCGGKLRDHIRRIALLCGTLDKSQAANIKSIFLFFREIDFTKFFVKMISRKK